MLKLYILCYQWVTKYVWKKICTQIILQNVTKTYKNNACDSK